MALVARSMEERETEGADRRAAPRILVVRFRAIGDVVMTTWAATALRQAFPEAHLTYACEPLPAAVLCTEGLVNEVIRFDRVAWKESRWSPKTWRDQIRTYARLRSRDFDLGFDMHGHSKTALALRLAKPRSRASVAATDALAARLNPAPDLFPKSAHQVDLFMALVRSLTPVREVVAPTLPVFARPDTTQSPLVTISTGASKREKLVPVEVWTAVADKLQSMGYRVATLGAEGDPMLNEDVATNLVGRLGLSQALGYVQQSALHLCGDTGSGHFAAASGIPTVSVFMSGRNHPSKYRPYGPTGRAVEAFTDPGWLDADRLVDFALDVRPRGAVWMED